MAEASSSELPRLPAGLRWSPEPASDEEVRLIGRRYCIVAQRPGAYHITDSDGTDYMRV